MFIWATVSFFSLSSALNEHELLKKQTIIIVIVCFFLSPDYQWTVLWLLAYNIGIPQRIENDINTFIHWWKRANHSRKYFVSRIKSLEQNHIKSMRELSRWKERRRKKNKIRQKDGSDGVIFFLLLQISIILIIVDNSTAIKYYNAINSSSSKQIMEKVSNFNDDKYVKLISLWFDFKRIFFQKE